MSDDTFGEPLLYLPAAVTRSIANNGAMPQGAFTIYGMVTADLISCNLILYVMLLLP